MVQGLCELLVGEVGIERVFCECLGEGLAHGMARHLATGVAPHPVAHDKETLFVCGRIAVGPPRVLLMVALSQLAERLGFKDMYTHGLNRF